MSRPSEQLTGEKGATAGRERRVLAALMALTALVYLRGLTGGFVWDDRVFFLDNDILPSWKPWELGRILLEPSTYWGDHIPATDFLFTLEHWLFGLWTPGYHLTSMLMYLFTGAMLYRLVIMIYGLARGGEGFTRIAEEGPWGDRGSALIAAAFFMLHPVHVEAVAYITGQKDLLYGFFSLAALYGLAAMRAGGRRGLWLPLAALSYYLAFMSKPMAAATAIFLPLFWFFVLRRRGEGLWRPFLFWSVLNLPAIGWFVFSLRKTVDLWSQLSMMGQRLLLGIKVLGAHLTIFLLPWPLNFGYPFNETIVFDPNMLMGMVFLAGAALVLAARPRSIYALGITVFLVFLLPVLQVFVRVPNAVVFDRYLYVSVLGGALVFERLAAAASRRLRTSPALWGAAVLLMVYAGLTAAYVPKFHSDVDSLRHAYTHFPGWKRPAFDYAYALVEAGQLEEAERMALTERTFESPGWVRPYFLGWIRIEQGRAAEALGYLELASHDAVFGGYYPFPDVHLGRAYMILGKKAKARGALGRVIARRSAQPVEYYKAIRLLRELEGQAGQ